MKKGYGRSHAYTQNPINSPTLLAMPLGLGPSRRTWWIHPMEAMTRPLWLVQWRVVLGSSGTTRPTHDTRRAIPWDMAWMWNRWGHSDSNLQRSPEILSSIASPFQSFLILFVSAQNLVGYAWVGLSHVYTVGISSSTDWKSTGDHWARFGWLLWFSGGCHAVCDGPQV